MHNTCRPCYILLQCQQVSKSLVSLPTIRPGCIPAARHCSRAGTCLCTSASSRLQYSKVSGVPTSVALRHGSFRGHACRCTSMGHGRGPGPADRLPNKLDKVCELAVVDAVHALRRCTAPLNTSSISDQGHLCFLLSH